MKGYFDHNATTPLHPAAREAQRAAEDRHWHNASGLYREAAAAKIALEDARESLADYLQVEPEEIIFTSGATEANNALVTWLALQETSRSLYLSALEHPSLREPASRFLKARDHWLAVSPQGFAQWPESPPAAGSVISLMAANNETGILQPWVKFAQLAAENHCLFHCDAAQWIGKMPRADFSGCDFVTGSAHKFGGPKGLGFLRISPRVTGFAGQRGGPQEGRRRAGTENVAAVVGLAAALAACVPEISPAGRDAFEAKIALALAETVRFVGTGCDRLPQTSLFILPRGRNTLWLARLSHLGFAVSTGSACSSGQGASEVLTAMGFSPEEMGRVLRVSGGPETTVESWLELAEALLEVSHGI